MDKSEAGALVLANDLKQLGQSPGLLGFQLAAVGGETRTNIRRNKYMKNTMRNRWSIPWFTWVSIGSSGW